MSELCAVCEQEPIEQQHHVLGREEFERLKMPMCKECHRMVHRVPLAQWKAADWASALSALWASADKRGRIMILKAMLVCREWLGLKGLRAQKASPPGVLEADWIRQVMRTRARVPSRPVMKQEVCTLVDEIIAITRKRAIEAASDDGAKELLSIARYSRTSVLMWALQILKRQLEKGGKR